MRLLYKALVQVSNRLFRSGKSSLILALFHGLQAPLVSGKIMIDGLEAKDTSLSIWRRAMRYVRLVK